MGSGYIHIQQMNLSMKAKTEREAFIQSLSYYQKKKDIESKKVFIKLDNAINTFIESVRDNEDI
jgi:excinuclease UvrABC helicase subunit UvrB